MNTDRAAERAARLLAANLTTHRLTRLPNGIRVATAEMPHMASVCLGIWVGIGSRHETAEENGAAHFIEHMLFKGTISRNAREIVTEVEGLGGYLNAFTAEDHTCFYARARGDRWRDLTVILTDMFFNSTFPAAEVKREREVIKEERAMYLDDPAQQTQEMLGDIMWPSHPLGRPIEGTEASLDNLDRKRLVDFMRSRYGAANVIVAAAGGISHEKLVRLLLRSTEKYHQPGRNDFEPIKSPSRRRRYRFAKRDIEQTQLALGIRTCSRLDSHRFPVRLLNAVLAENMSSRLYQVLREEEALAYSVDGHPSFLADTGSLGITAGVDSRRLDRALKLIGIELDRLRRRAVSKRELNRARDYVLGQFDLYLESTENHMNWIGEMVLGQNQIVRPSVVKKRLASVTASDIKSAAVEFFAPLNLSLAVVGPCRPTRSAVQSLMECP